MGTTVRFRGQRLSWRKSQEEGLLVDLDTCQVHRFDAVGARIIEGLMAGESLDVLAEQIVREGNDAPEARRRIRKLVAELEALGILRVVPPADARPRRSSRG